MLPFFYLLISAHKGFLSFMLKCTYLTSRLCSSLLHTINQLFSFVQSIYCNCYSFLVVVQNVRRGFLLLDGIALTCDELVSANIRVVY